MEPRSFIFIKTDNRGKTKKSDRKRIRSQCMNGRNLRIGIGPVPSVESDVTGHTSSQAPSRRSFQRQPIQQPAITSSDRADDTQGTLHEQLAQLVVPRGPKSDLSVLADNADARARLHVFHFLTHASHVTYPVELCTDFDLAQSNGIRWMFEDTTYLHFVLFFTSAINDAFLKRPWGRTSYYHMAQTITSLNDKLARNELEDSTIAVVSSLVIVCAILTDYTAAKTHFTGLQQMVRLRGGLEAFRDNLGLYIKLARVDLAYALHTGQAPLFIHPGFLAYVQPSAVTSGTPHGSHIKDDSDNSDYPSSSLSSPISPRSYLQIPKVLETLLDDSSVVSVFSDLQRLSCSLNHRRRLQDSDFKLAICSIQYRLLLLEGTLDDTMAECLRLAMLTFLTTTFEIPEGPGQRYPHLSRKFRESCCALIGDSMPGMLSGFATWLLVIGGVSLYGLDEDWLCKRWRSLVPVGASWYEVRRGLKTFLWIDAVHDRLGKEMVNTLDQNGARKMATGKTKSSPWWLSGWGICPLEL